MASVRTLLVLANLDEDARQTLVSEAEAAGYHACVVDTLQAAVLALTMRRPAAMLVGLDLPVAPTLCQKVRSKRCSVDTAILGVVETVDDKSFARALAWGVDDVVSLRRRGLLGIRLAALPADPSVLATARGHALVAIRDPVHAAEVERALLNAGYAVELATDALAVQRAGSSERVRLVVASTDYLQLRRMVEGARTGGHVASWVLVSPDPDVSGVEQTLSGLARVAVVSREDPLDNVLFVANELAAVDPRATCALGRILHGTLVEFREGGGRMVDWGYSYHVAQDGLYVRTLAPPLGNQVHLELTPPLGARRIVLQGTVVWRRGFGSLGVATAPAGFEVRITASPEGHLQEWTSGWNKLASRRGPDLPPDSRDSTPPLRNSLPNPASPASWRTIESQRREEFPACGSHTGSQFSRDSSPRPWRNADTGSVDRGPAPVAAAWTHAGDPTRVKRGVSTPVAVAVLGAGVCLGATGLWTPTWLTAPEPSRTGPAAEPSATQAPAAQRRGDGGPRAHAGERSAPISRRPAPGERAPGVALAGVARGAEPVGGGALPDAASSSPPPLDSGLQGDRDVTAAPRATQSPEQPSLSGLLSYEGWVLVRSPLDTGVFVNGARVGRTNQQVKARCGLKYVRLADSPGIWLSVGKTVSIECLGHTETTILPVPSP